MKHFLFAIICFLSIQTLQSQQLVYPPCVKHTVVDTFFNHYLVTDNYRWLENVRSDSAVAWIETEKKIAAKFLQNRLQLLLQA